MEVNEQLLNKARSAATKLADAETQVEVARAEYHAVVRRMHLAGLIEDRSALPVTAAARSSLVWSGVKTYAARTPKRHVFEEATIGGKDRA